MNVIQKMTYGIEYFAEKLQKKDNKLIKHVRIL